MKKFMWLIIAGAVAAVLIILFILFSTSQNRSTSLRITLVDAVSKSWVYNSTIRLRNRVIRGFKSTSFTFKNLKTGRHLLSVSAPNYESKEIEVTLHGGENIVKDPIELAGLAIPNLDSISIFEKKEENDIFLDIRLVGKDGHAITDHPCLPIKVILRISVQLVNGEYEMYKEGDEITRGKLLFSGEADWSWNTGLSATYRYSAHIPLASIAVTPSPYWIAVYLILLPNPQKITSGEVDAIVQHVYKIDEPEDLNEYLSGYSDSIDYYLIVKPNVENLFGGGM